MFEKVYLQELYEKGKVTNKKYRFQPDIVKRYQNRIEILLNSESVEELYLIHSLNYEVLKGNKFGISSIRINNKYRIEFKVTYVGADKMLTICNILELSNHYK